MADRTRASIEIGASADAVMAVIADLPAYPEWTGEVKQVDVLEAEPETGRARRALLVIDGGALRDRQELAYTYDGATAVRWSLVKGDMLRALEGAYTLTPSADGAGTTVEYTLAVDTKIPLLGLMKSKMEKVIIDRALAGLKKRVESLR
ncbi:SRPBCC family protein [Actinospica durhamensis]|uniref:SRPBCC family protein n=1 Tax=Actinospica durhamensis TaxID=1508375 RepID=A0A941EKG7_9ACTN|nr:SRPBCC family protein [Actinospica durhamensis]MBR7832177.1 SRPBCC family protein [Actinospica durhamensis]